MLSVWTPGRLQLHRLFRCETRNARKRPETGRPDVDFKPVQTPLRLTAKTACNYTKRPEVESPPAAAVECRKSHLARATVEPEAGKADLARIPSRERETCASSSADPKQ
jgi:hypothetical protein